MLGDPGVQLLAFRHHAVGACRGVFLLCSSRYDDAMATYRKEVLLARELAANGITVGRLHYRGTGNSDDLPEGLAAGLSSMVSDASMVLRWLREAQPSVPLTVGGVRFGALVGAGVVASEPSASLVLWEPAVTGPDYFREMFRAVRVAATRAAPPSTSEAPIPALDVLREQGWVEALCYRVELASYTDVEKCTLVGELGSVPRHLLLVQLGREAVVRPAYARVLTELEASGWACTVLNVQRRQDWWFVNDEWAPEEHEQETAELVEGVTRWVLDRTKAST